MQDLRTIKQRMSAIRNIRKIAEAMKMVSTVKYWRLQEPLRTYRIIGEEMKAFIPPALQRASEIEEAAVEEKTLVLAFFPHRGMCGSLTQNLLHAVAQWYPDPQNVQFAVFGKKGATMLSTERFGRIECPVLSTEALDDAQVIELARFIANGVSEGRFTRVEGVTAEFHNLLRQTPSRITLIPLAVPEPAEAKTETENGQVIAEVELEPDPETVFHLFLPMYLECQIRRLICDSMVSEHASRMTAMDNASKNAQELLENFRLEYNKIRQSKITLELMEIISGSEALK